MCRITEAASTYTNGAGLPIIFTAYTGWGYVDGDYSGTQLGTQAPLDCGGYAVNVYSCSDIVTGNTIFVIAVKGVHLTFPSDLQWKDDLATYNKTIVDSWAREYMPDQGTTVWKSPVTLERYQEGFMYSPVITIGSGLEMRIFHDREYESASIGRTQVIGESILYRFNFDRLMTERNTTVSSVSWSVKSGNATISTETLTNNKADAIISTTKQGIVLIEITATLADTTKRVKYLTLNVISPGNYVDSY